VNARRAGAADVEALADLYREAVLALGPQVYTAEQVHAWARSTEDRERFAHYILDAETWIDEGDGGVPRGFCGIAVHDGVGEVHSLYVRSALTRRGLGSDLLAHALEHARATGAARFEAWATPFSMPVFERAGFMLVRTVSEPYQGVMFERYRMAMPLPGLVTARIGPD
jgi:putative acetyltransferase